MAMSQIYRLDQRFLFRHKKELHPRVEVIYINLLQIYDLPKQSMHGIYIYTTFTIKICQLWVNIPYMDDMSYVNIG